MKIVFGKASLKFAKIRFFIFFIAAVILIMSLFFGILAQIRPVFEEKVSHAARVNAIEVINAATESVFSGMNSKDLVSVMTDENGMVTSISANTIEMNKLKSELSKTIHTICKNAENSKVTIPIGSLTNFPVLQGMGYRIPIKISTDGYAKIDFDDEFMNAGINQVKHKIFMTVSVRASVISAVMTKSEEVKTEIPVAETVISGTVPNYFGENLSVVGR